MRRPTSLALGLPAVLLLLAACSPGATAAPTTAPATTTPATTVPASAGPAAGGVTVDAKPVGSAGTVLVAGSNGMTVYMFTKDVKDSGTSACSGGCLETWPALTVAASRRAQSAPRPR